MLGLEPVPRSSLSDAVFEQLAAQILSERVSAGQTLPSERDLAKALGVNRGAVREGLKRLAQAGLIEQRHGGGTRVLDYRRHGGLDLLTRLLVAPDGGPDVAVARAIMEMRAALGPDIVRLCAQRAGPSVVAELRAVLASMRAAAEGTEDLDRLQLLSLDLWDSMVQGADNIAYRLAFNTLRHTYEQIRDALVIAMAPELRAIDACERMVDAIAGAEPERAQHEASEIVALGSQGVLTALELLNQLDQRVDERKQP